MALYSLEGIALLAQVIERMAVDVQGHLEVMRMAVHALRAENAAAAVAPPAPTAPPPEPDAPPPPRVLHVVSSAPRPVSGLQRENLIHREILAMFRADPRPWRAQDVEAALRARGYPRTLRQIRGRLWCMLDRLELTSVGPNQFVLREDRLGQRARGDA